MGKAIIKRGREGAWNCVYFEKFLEGDPEKSVET